jgi:alpha-D-ribose 1-methylphosphonate 5-triphosphate synthase subunit PhnL
MATATEPQPGNRSAAAECVLLIGVQGSGKSAFFKREFADTHVRINRDMLKTRAREAQFFNLCLETAQSCVIDNTNAPAVERARFIAAAKAKGFTVMGYYFDVPVRDAIARNAARPAAQRIPVPGIYATAKRMEPPSYAEGFDALHRVTLAGNDLAAAIIPRDE